MTTYGLTAALCTGLLIWAITPEAAAGVCAVPTLHGRQLGGEVTYRLGDREMPVGEAAIELLDGSGVSVVATTADDHGGFSIVVPRAGTFTLRVRAPGFFEVAARVVSRHSSNRASRIRVELGSDAILPCGGGSIRTAEDSRSKP